MLWTGSDCVVGFAYLLPQASAGAVAANVLTDLGLPCDCLSGDALDRLLLAAPLPRAQGAVVREQLGLPSRPRRRCARCLALVTASNVASLCHPLQRLLGNGLGGFLGVST